MDADAFIEIGRVARTHGLNGEVSVIVAGELLADRLVGLEVWFVPPPPGLRSARISGIRPGPKGPLFALDGVTGISEAQALRGCAVLARSVDVPEVADAFSPVGFAVADSTRGLIGTVEDVIVTGANDVWVVQGPFGQVLIPVIDEVVREIDEEQMTIGVTLLPGLVEESR
jgi:16S rRNA processing protein RimM